MVFQCLIFIVNVRIIIQIYIFDVIYNLVIIKFVLYVRIVNGFCFSRIGYYMIGGIFLYGFYFFIYVVVIYQFFGI